LYFGFSQLVRGFGFSEQASATTPTNVLVNRPSDDKYPYIAQREESVAVSLLDHQHAVIGFNDLDEQLYPNSISGFSYSSDQGATWNDRGVISVPVVGGCAGSTTEIR
jgi:hypothetical protein